VRASIVHPETSWEEAMPQVWATFEEIAELFDLDVTGARNHVIANQWERRRYTDGITRAILPPDAARKLMIGYAAQLTQPHERTGSAERTEGCLEQVGIGAKENGPNAVHRGINTIPWGMISRVDHDLKHGAPLFRLHCAITPTRSGMMPPVLAI
jgi:hypothetical protein